MNAAEFARLSNLYRQSKTIAVVGASENPEKAAHQIPRYMQTHGFPIRPVNPRGGMMFGEPVARSLSQVRGPIDIVNVFRPAREAPDIARQAIAIGAKVLWLQLEISSPEAERIAHAAGLEVVMDRCIGYAYYAVGRGPNPTPSRI